MDLLLAQDSQDWLRRVLQPEVLVFMVAIVAIITGGAVRITRSLLQHRERITAIQNGFDPDGNQPDSNRDSATF